MVNIQVSVDEEQVMRPILKEAIEFLQLGIKNLESKTHLKPYQEQDLEDDKKYLEAIKVTYEYFCGT